MVFYPEVQRRAQEEIGTVIGRDRLPNLEDRDTLPYIRAMYLELLRWKVISPLGECSFDWNLRLSERILTV